MNRQKSLNAIFLVGLTVLFVGLLTSPAFGAKPDVQGRPDPQADENPPVVTIDSPEEGESFTGTVTIEISATDDESGIAEVRCDFPDGSSLTDKRSPYAFEWDVSDVEDGVYQIWVTAEDKSGNEASTSVTINVGAREDTPGIVTISSPEENAVVFDSVAITASASDADGLDSVQCFVAEDDYGDQIPLGVLPDDPSGTFDWSWNTDDYADGIYFITVVAYDQYGGQGSGSIRVTLDQGAANPTVVSISAPDEDGIVFGLVPISAAASDADGLDSVQCFVAEDDYGDLIPLGVQPDDPSGTFEWSWNTDDYADGIYFITVVAYDQYGGQGSSNIRITLDQSANSPTSVSITAPEYNDVVFGVVPISATASDADGLDSVQCFVAEDDYGDLIPLGVLPDDPSGTFDWSWNTDDYADGIYFITVVAYDQYGGQGSSNIRVTLERSMANPTLVSITSPQEDDILFDVVQIAATASDADGLDSVQCFVAEDDYGDLIPLGVQPDDPSGTFEWSWNTDDYADGIYFITVVAYDQYGGQGSSNIRVTLDQSVNSPTVVSITSPQEDDILSGVVPVTATASDADGLDSVQCFVAEDDYGDLIPLGVLPDDPSGTFDWSWNTDDYADGIYFITVVAYDQYGGQGSSNIRVTLERSMANPTLVSITSPQEDDILFDVVQIAATASDADGLDSVQCFVAEDDYGDLIPLGVQPDDPSGTFEWSWNTDDYADGIYFITVVAYDQYGGQGSSNIRITLDQSVNSPTVVSITSPQEDDILSGVVPVTATASDADGLDSVQCFVAEDDYGDLIPLGVQPDDPSGTFEWSWNTDDYADGIYFITVVAYDQYGGQGSSNIRVTLDQSAANPTLVSITAPEEDEHLFDVVTISATASDADGLDSVQCFVAEDDYGDLIPLGVLPDDPSGTFDWSWNTDDYADGIYFITVVAYDQYGGQGSSNIRVTLDQSAANPTLVSITAPEEDEHLFDVVTISATASDADGLDSVQCFVAEDDYGDLIPLGVQPDDPSGTFEWSWNTDDYADGIYFITVVAYDQSGGQGSSNIRVTLDQSAANPTLVSITAPEEDEHLFDVVTISATASDADGLDSVQCFVAEDDYGDLIPLGVQPDDPSGTFEWSWNTDDYADGIYFITVVAYDQYGGQGSSNIRVTLDQSAANPTLVSITAPEEDEHVFDVVTISATASDADGLDSVQCFVAEDDYGDLIPLGVLPDDPSGTFEWSWNTDDYADGIYFITVVAYDQYGGQGSSNIRVTLDQSAANPTLVSITAPEEDEHLFDVVTISATASDADGLDSVQCFVAEDDYGDLIPLGVQPDDPSGTFEWSWNTDDYADGIYFITVVAYDQYGGQGSSNIRVTLDQSAANPTLVSITAPEEDEHLFDVVTITATASDADGLDSVQCFVAEDDYGDLIPLGVQPDDPSGTFEWSWNTDDYADGIYFITVVAYDQYGGQGSSNIRVTLDQSAANPTLVSITAPEEDEHLFDVVTISATASDADGLDSVQCFVAEDDYGDLIPLGVQPDDPSGTFEWSWNTDDYADGIYFITVVAYDQYGGQGSSNIRVTLDQSAANPTLVSITSPQYNAVLFDVVPIAATASDADGLDSVQCFVAEDDYGDLIPLGVLPDDPSGTFDWSWNTDDYADGIYFITVVAYDQYGGQGSSHIRVTLDQSAANPTVVSITSPQEDDILFDVVPIAATASDADGLDSVQCFIAEDNYGDLIPLGVRSARPSGTYEWSWNTDDYADGIYFITVVAYDQYGGMGSNHIRVTLDQSAADATLVSIISPQGDAVLFDVVPITATAYDADGLDSVQCFVAEDNYGELIPLGVHSAHPSGTYEWSWNTNDYADGIYFITVVAYDQYGGQGSSWIRVAVDQSAASNATVYISSPTDGSTFTVGADIPIQAGTNDPEGTISRVEFFANGNPVGTDTESPYEAVFEDAAAGTYELVAKAFDANGLLAESVPVSISVLGAGGIAITSPTDGSVYTAGDDVRIVATVNDPDDQVTRVEFFANGNLLGSDPTSPYEHTYYNVPAGNINLTAKSFDAGGLLSTSAVVSITVLGEGDLDVGFTPGSFAVNDLGSATYSIPIAAAPGTANMTPEISLKYNSQGRNGLAGVGWDIGGLSYIARTGRTIAQDGVNGGINMDANDRLALDGKRLINHTGNYWGVGTQYRTEVETFSKVTEMNGYFEVRTKSGEIMYYGETENARMINAATNKTMVWAISRICDRFGNYIRFWYTKIDGRLLPTSAAYTMNDNAGYPDQYAQVQFNYGPRPDTTMAYVKGSYTALTRRLSEVHCYNEGSIIRKYILGYEVDPSDGNSHLISVREEDGNGNSLRPTQFTNDIKDGGFIEASGFEPELCGDYCDYISTVVSGQTISLGAALVDLNGDGKTDMVKGVELWGAEGYDPGETIYKAWLSTGSGWVEAPQYAPPTAISIAVIYAATGYDLGVRFVDLNGDGLADMIQGLYDDGIPVRKAWLNNGDGWTYSGDYESPVEISGWADGYRGGWDGGVKFVDLNGDGLTDIMKGIEISGDPQCSAWLNTGSGWTPVSDKYKPPVAFVGWNRDCYVGWDYGVRMADLNGDGLLDMVKAHDDDNNVTKGAWINLGPGTGYRWQNVSDKYNPPALIAGNADDFQSGWDRGAALIDLNGDGLTDFLQAHHDFGTYHLNAWLNNGDGWTWTKAYEPPLAISGRDEHAINGWDMGVRLLDLNADGLTDIVRGQEYFMTNHLDAWLNTGDGWTQDKSYAPPVPIAGRGEVNYKGYGYGLRYGDFDGDGFPDLIQAWKYSSASLTIISDKAWLNTGTKPYLKKIETAVGRQTNIDYRPITDNSIYTKGSGSTYPTLELQIPYDVVSSYSTSNGVGGLNTLNYKYRKLRANLHGRGWQGFSCVEIHDPARDSRILRYFRQDFPYTYMLLAQDDCQLKNGTVQIMEHSDNRYGYLESGGIYRVRTNSIYRYEKEYNDLAVVKSSTVSYSNYDNYDNPWQVVTNVENGSGSQHFRTTEDNVYTNDANNWILGRLTSATVTHSLPDEAKPNIVRKSSFGYYSGTGALQTETIEPGTNYELTTTYTYDSFGNREKATVSGYNITSRDRQTVYDWRGRFAIQSINEFGHIIETDYDRRFGLAKTVTLYPYGENVVTRYQYDGFARLIRTDHPDGTYTSVTYNWTSSPSYAAYKKTTHTPNVSAPTAEYHDCLDRAIRTEAVDRFGRAAFADVQFDAHGRVTGRSEPFFEGQSANWTTISYDVVDRPTYVSLPDGAYANMTYDGLITTRTENGSISTTKEVDARGNLTRVVDGLNNTTRYEYNAVGDLTATVDAFWNRVENTYDNMGHKIVTDDPDMGYWTYQYNALGEMWRQTDAKSQSTSFEFDLLGRTRKRFAPEGTTEWVYDTRFKGKLSYVTSPGGYRKDVYYDALGRVTDVTEQIDGSSYNVHNSYDSHGRVDVTTYPACGNGDVKVKNVYNGNGYVNELRDPVADAMYWQAINADASGRITERKLGNGITTNRSYDEMGRPTSITSGSIQDLDYDWNSHGNLNYRIDGGGREDFTYDDLHRLKSWTKGVNAVSYDYNAIGNITYKSNVGFYAYNPDRPHAVSGAGSWAYGYDANGNMTSNGTDGQLKTIVYTSFNKPSSLTRAGTTFTFGYSSDYRRVRKEGPLAKTIYVGDAYEKVSKSDMETHKYYIAGGACVFEKVAAVNGTTHIWQPDLKKYVLKDHLGSTHVVTGSGGGVIEKYEYAPFGKKTEIIAGDCTRGFTGHEHDDEFGLINMKARMYDPVLGRFLSPDPFIQKLDDAQSFNRYSYVMNNPLRYTDPTGYFLDGLFDFIGDIFSAIGNALGGIWDAVCSLLENPIVRMVIAMYIGWAMPAWLPSGWAVPLKHGIAGAVGSAIASGGDLKSIVIGFASGAAFGFIGKSPIFDSAGKIPIKRILAHAFVGGVRSKLHGGKFIHGALAAGVGKAAAGPISEYFDDNVLGGAIASGVVSGTASKLTGGKFANGFATGAMAYTFNQMGGCLEERPKVNGMTVGGQQMEMLQDQWGYFEEFDIDVAALGTISGTAGARLAFGGYPEYEIFAKANGMRWYWASNWSKGMNYGRFLWESFSGSEFYRVSQGGPITRMEAGAIGTGITLRSAMLQIWSAGMGTSLYHRSVTVPHSKVYEIQTDM